MIYEYRCQQCEHITEAIRTVAERYNSPLCEKCGCQTSKIVSTGTAVHGDIKPYLDEHIGNGEPVHVKSKQHRKQLMKDFGVSEL